MRPIFPSPRPRLPERPQEAPKDPRPTIICEQVGRFLITTHRRRFSFSQDVAAALIRYRSRNISWLYWTTGENK
jgi:hypothetical protein